MTGLKVLVAGMLMAVTGTAPAPAVDAQAAFNRLKTLEGTWTAPAKDGKQATTRFEVVGNGSVVMEHYTNPALPGGGHMMTAYHLDGQDLVLTHYCIAKNQPTLKASTFDAATGEVQFEFVRATNLATPTAGHMHRALYRMSSADSFTTEWEFFKDGKRSFTETEVFTRSR